MHPQHKHLIGLSRFLHSTSTIRQKADVKLIAEIRKKMPISMSKARDALLATDNHLPSALAWLEKDAITSGATKASKLSSRETKEGLITAVVGSLGAGAALVEVGCETDFVSRNALFGELASRIGTTALFLGVSESTLGVSFPAVEHLLKIPLLPGPTDSHSEGETKTVGEGISEVVGKVGENILLKRVAVSPSKTKANVVTISGAYVHPNSNTGRLGALVVLEARGNQVISKRDTLATLARNVSHHVVGFAPVDVVSEEGLYSQQYFMGGGTVRQVLDTTIQSLALDSLEVVDMTRFELASQ
jgi:elongation factor Ts